MISSVEKLTSGGQTMMKVANDSIMMVGDLGLAQCTTRIDAFSGLFLYSNRFISWTTGKLLFSVG
jgi:hypothetical protein